MKRPKPSAGQPRRSMAGYVRFVADLKQRVLNAQLRAARALNEEMTGLYWQMGDIIIHQQAKYGWGRAVIPRLSADLRKEFPDLDGFSERNLGYMIRFAREYGVPPILQQTAAKLGGAETGQRTDARAAVDVADGILPRVVAKLPWFHHVVLMERVKDRAERFWYMQQAVEQGWSHAVLTAQIAARERELEQGLIDHIQKFLVTLGVGFAFVGREVHLEIAGQDYYLDLVKAAAFKPEFAGKMNFYPSAVDTQLRHRDDQPTIGLRLCQENDKITVEHALRDVKKPIGVAQWKTKLVDSLPKNLRGTLPSVAELERELSRG